MRYQFEPRANMPNINLDKAREAAAQNGATHIQERFPILYETGADGYPVSPWVGTNQPRTIRFSADSDEVAKAICLAYDIEQAFVWNLTERHYA